MKDLSWEDIYKDLRNKKYEPVYLLMGEEPFFIDVLSDYIEDKILSDDEKEFNQTVVYGRDTDAASIVSMAKRYPMMSEHQVVIVKEAQNIKDLELLESYAKNPLKSTILVICHKYKPVDKRKGFYKAVLKGGVVLDSKKLYDDKVPGWILSYVKRHGYVIKEPSAQLLADHLGNDLGKIVNEIKKVFISLSKGSEITPQLIEQNIGISKDFNVFELQKAFAVNDSYKAFQIVKYFAENPKSNPMPVTMALLYTYFVRALRYHFLKDKTPKNVASQIGISPYFIKDVQAAASRFPASKIILIMSYLREYDLKSKGVESANTDHGELLKELVFKILN